MLLQRAGGAMVVFLPGGRVDANEDPLTGGLPELKEQTRQVLTGSVEFLGALPSQAYNLEVLWFH
jgi:ADP-ribose pyrophosphatase YjhB (NUDIX family)